jgi:hypothetical protein
MPRSLPASLVLLFLAACTPEAPPPVSPPAPTSTAAPAPPAKESTVDEIRREARALDPSVRTGLAKEFLAAAAGLPHEAPRRLWHDAEKKHYYTDADAARLADADRRALVAQDVDEELFYVARFGTPIAYARPLEILGQERGALAGKRVLDFGFGQIGQLRMFASMGAKATGIDVEPLLQALHSAPGDQGSFGDRGGEIRMLFGFFPADTKLRDAAGGGYDLFLSKNVLKRGYIHPERPAEEKHLIRLGVDDETFVRTVHGMLVPGGRALIYNLAPAQAPPDKPYIPWADGRCPFARELWEKAGFKVIEFDRDDTAAARAMGHTLGWDQGEDKMDLEHDLFGTYTLVEKPKG